MNGARAFWSPRFGTFPDPHATEMITELLGIEAMTPPQPDLFGAETRQADLPEGMIYRSALISAAEEAALAAQMAELPFAPFQFHGFEGNRRTVSYGFHYSFDGSGLHEAAPIPDWLHPVREKAAALAGLPAEAIQHALLIEYAPGAGIGWHRDRPVFGDVVGISLLAPARLRFRRQQDGK